MPVSKDLFKEVCRRWVSGITVVTTRREGGIHGMTANSFCALSADPPLILVCVDRSARTHDLIAEQQAFGIHFLRADQSGLSDRCAGFLGDEGNLLDSVAHGTAETGAPILTDCAAWLDCRLWAAYDGGDHTVYVGQVEAAEAGEGFPLLWFNRSYHVLRGS